MSNIYKISCSIQLIVIKWYAYNTKIFDRRMIMQKTKLGISVGLLGAALYFLGLVNFYGLIILAGYVLLMESNEWLRKSAVKAVAIVIGFSLISIAVGFGNDILGLINNLLSIVNIDFRLSWPLNLDSIISNVISGLSKIILVVLGFRAFNQGSMAVGPIDKVVNKHI